MRISLGLGVFLAIVVGAFATRFYSHQRFGNGGAYRHPAAIPPGLLDISSDQVLDSSMKKRILAGTKGWRDEGNFAVTLGHFIARGADGETNQFCELYKDIALTFSGEGMAVSGARPTMTVESPCLIAQDTDSTMPIWIPVDLIKSEKPVDAELRFTTPSDVMIKLRDLPGEWPNYWILTEIKFLNKKDGRSVVIDKLSIYKMAAIPVSMTW